MISEDFELALISGIDLPTQYHVVSTSDIGLPDQNQGPIAAGAETFGETFDPDTGIGYVAVAKDASDATTKRVQSAKTILSPMSAQNSREAVQSQGVHSGEILAIISKYTATEILKALDTLTAHFEMSGSSVAFGYDARFDAIKLSGKLSEKLSNSIPEINVAYYLEPGELQDALYNEDARAPFIGGSAIYGYKNGELFRCTSGIPAKNSKSTQRY